MHERYRRQTDRRQTDRRQTDGRQHIANVNMSSRSLKIGRSQNHPRSGGNDTAFDQLNAFFVRPFVGTVRPMLSDRCLFCPVCL